MPGLLLYIATAAALVFLARRWVLPLSRSAGVALALLPLVITGRALLTGGVYGPIDLAYETEPLASVARDHGVERVVNPLLTDVQRLMIPWKKAVRHAFAHGEAPLWNPFSFSGDILAAASEPSPWHPFHLLSYLLPLAQSITFHATLVLFAAALCAFLFARDLGASEPASYVAAIGWMLSTFLLFFAQVPLGSVVLLQPLVLIAVRRIVREPRYAHVVLLAIVLALTVIGGHPESTLHVVGVGVAYGAFELFRPRPVVKPLLAAIAAGVLALLLSAIHLLPFVEALPQSADYQFRATSMSRESRAVPMAEAGERLLMNFVPFVFGSAAAEDAHIPPRWREPVYGYAGSLLFAPALFALFRWRDRVRWFLLALLVVGFLAGVSAPGVSHALSRLPLFDIALNQRLVYGGVLALSILAALGVELWMREQPRALALTTAGVLLALTALIAILWLPMQRDGLSLPYLRAHAIRELIPLALCAAFLLQRPSGRAGAVAVIALLLLQRTPPEESALTPTYRASALYPSTPLLDALPKDGAPYRVVGKSAAMVPNTSIHYEIEDPRGFHGMTFAPLRQTLELWSRMQPVSFNAVDRLDTPFLSFLNVRFAIDSPTDPLPPGWRVHRVFRGARLVENTRVLPRAFVPRSVAPALGMLPLAIAEDFAERAWIEGATEGANAAGRVDVRRNGTGLDLTATMEREGWVVISETAWKGWRATLDGRDAPLHFANLSFLAVRVPAGMHRVELRYLPRSFVIGATLTLTTLLGMIVFPRIHFRHTALSALLLFAAFPAFASVPSKRLFVPAAGRVTTASGEYTTDLWITNGSSSKATVKIALLPAGTATADPQFETVDVPARSTRQFDNVTETLLRRPGILGALLLESTEPIAASARVAAAGRGSALNAVPIEFAAGRDDVAVLHGAGSGGGRFRYNIHLVETNRSGVMVTLTLRDDRGQEAGRREFLLRELESLTVPVSDITKNVPAQATVEIRVARGAGRVIAAGSQISNDAHDPSTFEMTFPRRQRTNVPLTETIVWIAAALAIVVSAISGWRRGR